MFLQALLINAVVLAVVLESDLGRQRPVTRFRVLRPLVTSLLIVPFFLRGAATAGTGLELELGLTAAGLLLALLALSLMRVFLSPETGKPVTRAGLGYALAWTAAIAARTVFSYGSAHWFAASLGRWMSGHHVTADTLTDALIFMAVAMVLTRVAVISIRARGARLRAGLSRNPVSPAVRTTTTAGPNPGPASRPAAASGVGRAAAVSAGVLASLWQNRQGERARRRSDRRTRRYPR